VGILHQTPPFQAQPQWDRAALVSPPAPLINPALSYYGTIKYLTHQKLWAPCLLCRLLNVEINT
jgi:hypothetical protein